MKYKISFPNIFKIKDKISAYFSVASQNGYFNSSKYQNKGQRTDLYIFDWVTFKWIHFLKGIVVCSNFFPVICIRHSLSFSGPLKCSCESTGCLEKSNAVDSGFKTSCRNILPCSSICDVER